MVGRGTDGARPHRTRRATFRAHAGGLSETDGNLIPLGLGDRRSAEAGFSAEADV